MALFIKSNCGLLHGETEWSLSICDHIWRKKVAKAKSEQNKGKIASLALFSVNGPWQAVLEEAAPITEHCLAIACHCHSLLDWCCIRAIVVNHTSKVLQYYSVCIIFQVFLIVGTYLSPQERKQMNVWFYNSTLNCLNVYSSAKRWLLVHKPLIPIFVLAFFPHFTIRSCQC